MEKIDMIIEKGSGGELLNTQEIELLMLHALELLDQIKFETLQSIRKANIEIAENYKQAA